MLHIVANSTPSYSKPPYSYKQTLASRKMRISPAKMQRLPFELRSKILAYTIDNNVTSLTIPPRNQDSWLQDMRNQLPAWLQLEDEEWDEATNVLIRHMLCVVTELTLLEPEDLLSKIPGNMQLTNVRSLTFTRPQNGYAKASETSKFSVHDVVQHCPQLQELTLPIKAAGLIEDYGPDFIHMLEHQSIAKLNLACNDTPEGRGYWGPDPRPIRPFEKWFLTDANGLGGRIDLSIDLSPNDHYNTMDPQRVRRTRGAMKWVEQHCWFG